MDFAIIGYFRRALGITAELILSSTLESKGHKSGRIIEICKELGAGAYISTNGAKSYLEEGLFEKNGIALAYQDYNPPEYQQVYPGFVSHLSIVDVVFNCGPASMDTILSTSSCPFNKHGFYCGIGRI